jgi:hypothetical protein
MTLDLAGAVAMVVAVLWLELALVKTITLVPQPELAEWGVLARCRRDLLFRCGLLVLMMVVSNPDGRLKPSDGKRLLLVVSHWDWSSLSLWLARLAGLSVISQGTLL